MSNSLIISDKAIFYSINIYFSDSYWQKNTVKKLPQAS